VAVIKALQVHLVKINHGRTYSRTCSVPFPLETKPVTNPAPRASLKTARAHSLVISGSLYVLTMTLLPGGWHREQVLRA